MAPPTQSTLKRRFSFVYDPEYEFALHGFVKDRLKEYNTVVPTWILPEEQENNVTILPTRDFIPDRSTLVKDSQDSRPQVPSASCECQ